MAEQSKLEMVCTGMVYKNQKMYTTCREFGEDRNLTGESHLYLGKIKGMAPGGVYECTFSEGSSLIVSGPNGPRYLRMHNDAGQVTQFQTAQSAAIASETAARRMKEETGKNNLREALGPIKTLMAKTNADGRRAILAVVLEELGVS